MTKNFAELFEESLKELESRPGSIVKGTVVSIEKDVVVVAAGLKSKSIISIDQFRDREGRVNLEVGDEVDVALDFNLGGFGETILSREKAKRHEAWVNIVKSFEEKTSVKGVITGRVNGGFTVDVNSVRAFLPGSKSGIPKGDCSPIEGRELDFQVIKVDAKRNDVVLSRFGLEKEKAERPPRIAIDTLSAGQTIRGVVKNVTDYGAFIDIGGIDGLLHKSEMNLQVKGIKSPSELLQVNDAVNVVIKQLDIQSKKISLSMRSPKDVSWELERENFTLGQKVTGKIIASSDEYYVLDLMNNVQGRIKSTAEQNIQLGNEIEAFVSSLNDEEKVIELTFTDRNKLSFSDIAGLL